MQIKDLDSIDSQKMYKIYDNWPEIARESFEIKFDRQKSFGFRCGWSGTINNFCFK